MIDINIDKILNRALSKHELFAKALFERPASLSSFLPYDEYLTEFGVFRQKDGSLGVVYEVELCEHETKNSQEIISVLEKLRSWFKVPEDLTLSLLFEQSEVSPHDPVWGRFGLSNLERSDLPRRLHLDHLNGLRNAKDGEFSLRRRLLLSIRNFKKPSGSLTGIRQIGIGLGDPNHTLSHELEGFIKQMRNFNHSLAQLEMTSPLRLQRLDANSLIGFLRSTFNPVTCFERPFAPLNPSVSLSNQIIYSSCDLDYPGIKREGRNTRTLTLKNAPGYAYPGSMVYFLDLRFPFRICMNVSFPSMMSVKRNIGMKEFFLQNTPSARSRRQRDELKVLQDQLVRDDRVLNMTFCVLLEGETEEQLERRTKECLVRFQQRLECEAIVEKEVGLGLWWNSLPLNYHPIADYTSKRSVPIAASDIVYFCPVFDSFRGTSEAQSVFLSREQGLVPFCLRSNGTSCTSVVLGDSSSGKTTLATELILGELRRDPKPLIFVIDHKTGWEMLSHFLPSELTTFEQRKPMPFSPFRGDMDEDKLRFLVQLLSSAILLNSPQFQLNSEHRTCLSQAIRHAYELKMKTHGVRYVDGNFLNAEDTSEMLVRLEDIIAALGALTGIPEFEKYATHVDDITMKLRPFFGDGIYASFFGRVDTPISSKKADLYIYDLAALSNDSILQPLVTMSVIEEIRRKITIEDGRARGGYIIFENIGMLGRNNPVAKDFVINASETFEKLGFSLIGLTPNPRDFFETDVGQAMWTLADHCFFLPMKEDNVDFIAKNSRVLDEAGVQVVKSLRLSRSEFSDCYYTHKSKGVSGSFRYTPSAEKLWLVPTKVSDAQEAEDTMLRFPSAPGKALRDLVKRHPNGTKVVSPASPGGGV